jgi:YgiT-type zinc finger domain-containing protein
MIDRTDNICVICGGQTSWKNESYTHKLNGEKFVINKFPVEVCLSCGEKYYHAEDLKKADNLVLSAKKDLVIV